jgi:hypothetical protein
MAPSATRNAQQNSASAAHRYKGSRRGRPAPVVSACVNHSPSEMAPTTMLNADKSTEPVKRQAYADANKLPRTGTAGPIVGTASPARRPESARMRICSRFSPGCSNCAGIGR